MKAKSSNFFIAGAPRRGTTALHEYHKRIRPFSCRRSKNHRDFCKESRIIAMVRNPLDMAYALHGQYLLAGWEDISDFQTAWNKQELRNSNDNLPVIARTVPCFNTGTCA